MYITITYKNKHFLIRYDPPDYSEVASKSISKQNEVELQDAHQKGENKISRKKSPMSIHISKAGKRTKSKLQSNRVTKPFCPPSGEVATTLTLILTIVAIFFTARTVLGPVADVGGTIFALLMLILGALIGGKLIVGFCWLLKRYCKINAYNYSFSFCCQV